MKRKNPEFNAKFREHLAHARKMNNLTVKQLASALGEKTETVSAWEKEAIDVVPPPPKIAAICRALHVSADYLLGLVDEPLPVARSGGVFRGWARGDGADGGDVIANAEGPSAHASNMFLPPAGNPDCRNCPAILSLSAALERLTGGRHAR